MENKDLCPRSSETRWKIKVIILRDMMQLKIIILIWGFHHTHRKKTSEKHTLRNLEHAIPTRGHQQKKETEPSNFKNCEIFMKFLLLISYAHRMMLIERGISIVVAVVVVVVVVIVAAVVAAAILVVIVAAVVAAAIHGIRGLMQCGKKQMNYSKK